MEEWKTIAGYPNYQVSSYGRVHSIKRDIILKPYYDNWRYPRVDLRNENGRRPRSVHRLVAEAFVPNPYDKPQVNHIDGDKDNNSVDNLEWVTVSENARHAVATGLNDHSKYHSGRPKRSVRVVETGQIFDSMTSCARALHCSHSNVVMYFKLGLGTCMGYHLELI